MESREPAYLLQEANLIGNRIVWYLEQHEKLEGLGLLSTGAVWAFVLTNKWTPATEYAVWLPTLLTVAMFFKSILFTRTLDEAFQYLFELEDYHMLSAGKGWVHYFRARSSRYKRRWRLSFWVLLLSLNVLGAAALPLQDLLAVPTNATGVQSPCDCSKN